MQTDIAPTIKITTVKIIIKDNKEKDAKAAKPVYKNTYANGRPFIWFPAIPYSEPWWEDDAPRLQWEKVYPGFSYKLFSLAIYLSMELDCKLIPRICPSESITRDDVIINVERLQSIMYACFFQKPVPEPYWLGDDQ
jgi:hypothetical protein